MFCEVHHVQRNKRRSEQKCCVFFWIFFDFSSEIDVRLGNTRARQRCAQHSIQIHVWNIVFWRKKYFWMIFVISPDPRQPPGAAQDSPRIDYSFHSLSVASENDSRQRPGGPRKLSGVPPGTSRVPFWVDFWIDFACQNHRKNVEETGQKYLMGRILRHGLRFGGFHPLGPAECAERLN